MANYSTKEKAIDIDSAVASVIACADGDGIIAATTETIRDRWQKLVGAFKGLDKGSRAATFKRLRDEVYVRLGKNADRKRCQRVRERLSRLKGAIGLKAAKRPPAEQTPPAAQTPASETITLGKGETITLAKPADGVIAAAGPARLNWMVNTLRKVMEETGIEEKAFKSLVRNALSVM